MLFLFIYGCTSIASLVCCEGTLKLKIFIYECPNNVKYYRLDLFMPHLYVFTNKKNVTLLVFHILIYLL